MLELKKVTLFRTNNQVWQFFVLGFRLLTILTAIETGVLGTGHDFAYENRIWH